MVTNNGDANAIRENSVKEVIGESFQIRAAQVANERMKPQWPSRSSFEVSLQFAPEFVSKMAGNFVISAQNAVYVLLDSRVVS